MKAVRRQARLEHSGGPTPDLLRPPFTPTPAPIVSSASVLTFPQSPGVDLSSMAGSPQDDMALFLAAQRGDTATVRTCLRDASEDDVFQGFLTAIEAKQPGVVQLCLDHWRSQGTLSKWVGNTMYLAINPGTAPLHLACAAGNAQVVTLLLDAGAPLDTTTGVFEAGIREEGDWRPLDVAVSCGHQAIIDELRSRGATQSRQHHRGLEGGFVCSWRNPMDERAWDCSRRRKDQREKSAEKRRLAVLVGGFVLVAVFGLVCWAGGGPAFIPQWLAIIMTFAPVWGCLGGFCISMADLFLRDWD